MSRVKVEFHKLIFTLFLIFISVSSQLLQQSTSQYDFSVTNYDVPKRNLSSTFFLGTSAENSPNISWSTKDGESPSENSTNQTGVKVEEILRQIFDAEFQETEEDNTEAELQNDEGEETNQKSSEVSSNTTTREGRAEYHLHSRRRYPNERNKTKRRNNDNNRNPQSKNNNNKRPNRKQNGNQRNNNRKGPKVNNNKNVKAKGKGGIDLTKYNAYMDAVLGRMNLLIRKKRMDPLRVNLYAGASPNQKQNQGKKKNNAGKNKRKNNPRLEEEESDPIEQSSSKDDDDEEQEDDDDDESSGSSEDGRSIRHVTVFNKDIFQRTGRDLSKNVTGIEEIQSGIVKVEEEIIEDEGEGRGKGKKKKQNEDQQSKEPKVKSTPGSSEANIKNKEEERKVPVKRNGPRPTRGILHGLSTLRRDGNVQVIRDGERARIIRSRFILGPVALEIIPKKNRKQQGNNPNTRDDVEAETMSTSSTTPPPAATATAPQLKGILEIRLSPGKATRIRKLRVFPPNRGNVQVLGDKKNGVNPGERRAGYRKVTPMASAKLRQAAVQVVRQVDHKMKLNSRH